MCLQISGYSDGAGAQHWFWKVQNPSLGLKMARDQNCVPNIHHKQKSANLISNLSSAINFLNRKLADHDNFINLKFGFDEKWFKILSNATFDSDTCNVSLCLENRSMPVFNMPTFHRELASIWYVLTHWGRDEMNNISQTTFLNVFSSMKMFEFRLKFHWSLFPRVQLTIFQHWFR